MHQRFSASLAAAMMMAGLAAAPAHAEAGDFILRARGIAVIPADKSSGIEPSFPTEKVSVSTGWSPELDLTYFITKNIGVEVIAATTKHTAKGRSGTTGSIGPLISTWVLPPTVTLQYHFVPDGAVRPYVGAGVNWSLFYSTNPTDELEKAVGTTRVDMTNSWGWALQAGIDIPIGEKMLLNFDVKYIDIDSTATLTNAALGVQKVRVNIDPLVVGAGIGFRF